jgi:thiamine kinase-like enzyme
MEPKFNILEYNLSRNLGNGTPVDLLVINNPDGSPRWFLPAHATKPHFLMFYHVGSLRSRAYAWIMELLFAVRLQHVLLKKERWYFHLKNTQTEPSFDILRDAWSLFTGTVGPNNKFVLYTQIAGNGFFWKLANTPTAVSLIDDEICAVNVLNSLKISTFEYPAMIKTSKNSLKMNQVGENGKRVNAFGKPHQRALAEIMDTSLEVRPLQTIFGFEQAMENIRRFRESPDSRIPNGLVQKLEYMFGCNQEKNVFCAYSHGDFTPWNLVVSDEQLSMFDLELAGVRPLGFDAFHFVVQKGILSERKSWSAIRREIEENIVPWLQPLVAETGKDWQYYLRLYLLINTAAHIGLYGRQPNWHTQVNWLLQTWNEALSDVLSDELSQRGMMIADLFSFLHPHPYAAVKFPDINPSELDPYADIDLITPKDLVPNILHLMKSHPLTASVQAQHKTFMSSVQIILKDASILNVDLIWDLKRKNLQMMEAGQVLLRAEVNVHGVKIMHPDDLADYLVLFYGLNGQAVPEKYRAYLSKTHPQSLWIRSTRTTRNLAWIRIRTRTTGNLAWIRSTRTTRNLAWIRKIPARNRLEIRRPLPLRNCCDSGRPTEDYRHFATRWPIFTTPSAVISDPQGLPSPLVGLMEPVNRPLLNWCAMKLKKNFGNVLLYFGIVLQYCPF